MYVGDKLNDNNISLRTKVAGNSGLNGGCSSTFSNRQSLSLNQGALRIQLASPEDMSKGQNFLFGSSKVAGPPAGTYPQSQYQ